MTKKNETVVKIAQTALMAALCFVSFQFLQFKIVLPGGDATSFHVGNAFCVLAALILGGWYGGLAGAIGMGFADILDPVYITGAPKTFVLKLSSVLWLIELRRSMKVQIRNTFSAGA